MFIRNPSLNFEQINLSVNFNIYIIIYYISGRVQRNLISHLLPDNSISSMVIFVSSIVLSPLPSLLFLFFLTWSFRAMLNCLAGYMYQISNLFPILLSSEIKEVQTVLRSDTTKSPGLSRHSDLLPSGNLNIIFSK